MGLQCIFVLAGSAKDNFFETFLGVVSALASFGTQIF